MNYIKQINFFWTKAKRHSLGAGEIAMYMYLLHISNDHDWENPVMEPNATLQHAIGVKSFNTLKEVRNRLQQAGLIQFKSRNGSANVEYNLFDVDLKTFAPTFSKNAKVPDEVTAKVVDEVTAKVPEKVPDSDVIILNKLKPKPKFTLEYFESIGFALPEMKPEFRKALNDFLEYREADKGHGPITNGHQLEQILKGFAERQINTADAVAMISNSIAKGFKNVVYELPKAGQHQQQQKDSNVTYKPPQNILNGKK